MGQLDIDTVTRHCPSEDQLRGISVEVLDDFSYSLSPWDRPTPDRPRRRSDENPDEAVFSSQRPKFEFLVERFNQPNIRIAVRIPCLYTSPNCGAFKRASWYPVTWSVSDGVAGPSLRGRLASGACPRFLGNRTYLLS